VCLHLNVAHVGTIFLLQECNVYCRIPGEHELSTQPWKLWCYATAGQPMSSFTFLSEILHSYCVCFDMHHSAVCCLRWCCCTWIKQCSSIFIFFINLFIKHHKVVTSEAPPPHLHLTTSEVMVIVWKLRGNITRTVLYIANVLPLQWAQLTKTVHTAQLGLEFVFLYSF